VRVSHRQLIILNTLCQMAGGVFLCLRFKKASKY
jgi:hypothetical protein